MISPMCGLPSECMLLTELLIFSTSLLNIALEHVNASAAAVPLYLTASLASRQTSVKQAKVNIFTEYHRGWKFQRVYISSVFVDISNAQIFQCAQSLRYLMSAVRNMALCIGICAQLIMEWLARHRAECGEEFLNTELNYAPVVAWHGT